MSGTYKVKLVARNEGIEYRDEHDVYRFAASLKNQKWTVYLPCSKGESYQVHELTDEERLLILPRIEQYLEGRKYYGLVGPSYPVTFKQEGPVSDEIKKARLRAARFFEKRKGGNQE
jgi:hypothetical protein